MFFTLVNCCITGFCILILLLCLVVLLAGQIELLPELLKLSIFACWSYLEILFRWVVPGRQKSIKGWTAVITGAGHGIGRHIAIGLARKGVKVVLWDINKDYLENVTKEISLLNGEVYSYICNVAKKHEVYETARKVQEEVGDVDILINNAGVVNGEVLLSCSDEKIENTMNVNVIAHFWTLKAFLGGMLKRDRGNVVAISSIMGILGAPALVDYCTSKSAVIMLMETLRQECLSQEKHGVCFTTIMPTKVDTGLFEGAKPRFSLLPPTVEPQYIAEKVIDAIERDKVYVVLPPWQSVMFAVKPLMPQKLLDAFMKFSGLDHAMETFTGHRKTN